MYIYIIGSCVCVCVSLSLSPSLSLYLAKGAQGGVTSASACKSANIATSARGSSVTLVELEVSASGDAALPSHVRHARRARCHQDPRCLTRI